MSNTDRTDWGGNAWHGIDGPAFLTCDLCDGREDPDDLTPDWNGDTGCHLSCERERAGAPLPAAPLPPDGVRWTHAPGDDPRTCWACVDDFVNAPDEPMGDHDPEPAGEDVDGTYCTCGHHIEPIP